MKFPKLRNGPNAIGEGLSRALDKLDVPFVSSEGVGYGANKYGNGAEVYGGGDDGYYSLGSLGFAFDTAPFNIAASFNARGSFLNRGDVTSAALTVPSLPYAGAGQGYTFKIPDDNVAEIYYTRFARSYTLKTSFLWYSSAGGSGIALGRTASSGPTGWHMGVCHLQPANYTPPALYPSAARFTYTKDSGKTWEYIEVSLGDGYNLSLPVPYILQPSITFMLMPLNTSINSPPSDTDWITQLYVNQSALIKITDYGAAGVEIPGGELISKLRILDDSKVDPSGMLTGSGNILSANQGIYAWGSSTGITRLRDGSTLATAGARFYGGDYFDYQYGVGRDGVYLFYGTIDGGFVMGDRLFIPGVQTASFILRPHGTNLVSLARPERVIVGSVDINLNEPVRFVVGNEDATSFEFKTTPWPTRYVGQLLALDEKVLVLNVYDPVDGKVVLMQTRDLGDTWTQRAIVKRDVPPPIESPVGDPSLLRFGVTTALRRDGAPANATAGAPWLSNSSRPLPWEP